MQLGSEQETRAARVVLAGACVAIFASAFEVIEPLVDLGPVAFTSSELAAAFFFVTAAYWVIRSPASAVRRRPLDLAVLIFLAVSFLSSAFAEDRPSAIKFSLRMAFAVLIYFGISRLPGRRYRSHVVVAAAIATTVSVVVAIGLLEALVFARYFYSPLTAFQEGITTFGSFLNLRTASTLPFPTTLSFYLELTLPVLLALALWLFRNAKGRGRKAVFIGAPVLVSCVYLVLLTTFTRSGLVALPVSLLAGMSLALLYRLDEKVWRIFAMAIILLPVMAASLAFFSNTMAVRFGVAEQEQRYNADYELLEELPQNMVPAGEYTSTLEVTNTSRVDWTRDGRDRVFLYYRWVTYPELEQVEYEYLTNLLPNDVDRGETVEFDVVFRTPEESGRYLLIFEMFKTHVGIFSDAGSYPELVPVEIDTGGSRLFELESEPPLEDLDARQPVLESVSRRELWSAAIEMWRDHPLLGVGSDQFRFRYRDYIEGDRHDERLRTHNIFLEAGANNGILGLAAMVYLLGAAAWVQLGLVRRRENGRAFRYFGLSLLVSTCVYVLHGMLDVFLWQTGATFMTFTLLGLTSWLACEARQQADTD